jgi:hypothetical protein
MFGLSMIGVLMLVVLENDLTRAFANFRRGFTRVSFVRSSRYSTQW